MSKHLKKLAAPRVWPLPRKDTIWATKPSPGPHPLDQSISLIMMLRDILRVCDNSREGKRIIGSRDVMVDGRVVTKPKYPMGLMDTLSLPKTGKHYRLLLDRRGKFFPSTIDKQRAEWKLVRIENKTTVKGGITQLNLHDGRNILLEENDYSSGDVLKIALPSQEIMDKFEMKKGNKAMVIAGKHAGELGTIDKVEIIRGPGQNIVWFEEGFSTTKGNVFMVGTKQPVINLAEVRGA